jgi:hypothetical protein
MKRLTLVVMIVVLFTLILLTPSSRAWLAARFGTSGDCGCSTACMGGKSCAINCPTGQAAHCDCVGGSEHTPQEAKCYCR